MNGWRCWVVVALAACQPGKSERLEWPKPIPATRPEASIPVEPPPVVTEAVPSIGIDISAFEPDPTRLLRWPLGLNDHISLEPHFPVAAALAQPGIEWTKLCSMGAQKRVLPLKLADQGVYLAGWCAALDHDVERAIITLAPLRSSIVSGLADAVRSDIAVLLTQQPTVADARKMLTKTKLNLDLLTLDRLVAMYLELQQETDAVEINELAITNDNLVDAPDACTRIARRFVIDEHAYENAMRIRRNAVHMYTEPDTHLFPASTLNDPVCRKLEAEIECWRGNQCDAWWALSSLPLADAYLAQMIAYWPTSSADPEAWLEVSRRAVNQLSSPQAVTLLMASMRNAIHVTRCSDMEHRDQIDALAVVVQLADSLPESVKLPFKQFFRPQQESSCWHGRNR